VVALGIDETRRGKSLRLEPLHRCSNIVPTVAHRFCLTWPVMTTRCHRASAVFSRHPRPGIGDRYVLAFRAAVREAFPRRDGGGRPLSPRTLATDGELGVVAGVTANAAGVPDPQDEMPRGSPKKNPALLPLVRPVRPAARSPHY